MDSRAIAKERMGALVALAREWFVRDEKLARRYVYLAWKIGQAHRIPSGNKEFCKECFAPYIPSLTVKVRSAKGKIMVYECLSCGEKKRFGFAKKKSERVKRVQKVNARATRK